MTEQERSFEPHQDHLLTALSVKPILVLLLAVCLTSPLMATAAAFDQNWMSRNLLHQQPDSRKADQSENQELKVGRALEREMAGGQAHSYRIALAPGQYLHVVVEQKGIDVVVRLFGPDGKQITEVDDNPTIGSESVWAIAETSGEYRLSVKSPDNSAKDGRYEIRIEELREATAKDRVQVTAERTFEQGNQLRDQRTADSRRKAIKKYEEALPLWQEVGDKGREALTLNEIGVIYANLGEQENALGYFNRAAPLWHAVGDRPNEATAFSNIAIAYWRLGESQKALKYHEQALQLRRAAGDRQGEGISLNGLGLVCSSSSQQQEALNYYKQALSVERSVGDQLMESTILNNIGSVNRALGEWQEALESFNQALRIARAIGNRQAIPAILANIGSVYRSLGDEQKALEYYDQALVLHQTTGNRQYEATTLDAMGSIHAKSADKRKALEYFERALAISQSVGDRRQQAYILSHYAELYERLGESQKALVYSNKALSLKQAIGDRLGEAVSLSDIGNSYSSLGEWQKALEYYHKALQLSRQVGDRIGEANRLNEIAHVERKLGNMKEARTQAELALDILESSRAKVISQELRTSFLASVQSFYEFYVDLLMRLHEDQTSAGLEAAALQASERARARSLLDILTEARADIRQGVDPVLVERERSLQQQLNAKAERLTRLLSGKHGEEQETAARKEVETLLTDYQGVEAEIRTKSPRYAALTQPKPLSLRKIQQELDRDTLLLEYALGEERSYLWAVTPTSIKSYELPKRAQIEAAARRAYQALTARNKIVRFEKQDQKRARIEASDVEYFSAATAFSQLVLGPVRKQLAKKRLLIVSEGALQYVPFGALPVPDGRPATGVNKREPRAASYRPLIVEHEVVSVPSASVLAELRKELTKRQSDANTVAVFADPVFQDDDPRVKRTQIKVDKEAGQSNKTRESENELERSAREIGDLTFERLPHTRQEAEGILAVAPKGKSMQALDFEANRPTAISADLSRYRIVHFATHGLLNNQHPELSGIVLSLVDQDGRSQNGFLRLYEIYNLKLGADLVVLSACRTALGKEIKGEGLVGLTRGFMYAGAARVIASVWGVEDASTAELMKSFYYEMMVKQQTAAAALRAAQLRMWRRQLPPYYWAAFVLHGEWK